MWEINYRIALTPKKNLTYHWNKFGIFAVAYRASAQTTSHIVSAKNMEENISYFVKEHIKKTRRCGKT